MLMPQQQHIDDISKWRSTLCASISLEAPVETQTACKLLQRKAGSIW